MGSLGTRSGLSVAMVMVSIGKPSTSVRKREQHFLLILHQLIVLTCSSTILSSQNQWMLKSGISWRTKKPSLVSLWLTASKLVSTIQVILSPPRSPLRTLFTPISIHLTVRVYKMVRVYTPFYTSLTQLHTVHISNNYVF